MLTCTYPTLNLITPIAFIYPTALVLRFGHSKSHFCHLKEGTFVKSVLFQVTKDGRFLFMGPIVWVSDFENKLAALLTY